MTYAKLTLKATVSSRAEASGQLRLPGDAVLVERGNPRWLVIACPCGCGSEIPVNLDPRAGPAWHLYRGARGLSVYPSVWRDTDCESHFIIHRDRIWMSESREDAWWLYDPVEDDGNLRRRTLAQLSAGVERNYQEMCAAIPDSVPWDVLRCCRSLVREGLATEGLGQRKGWFRLSEQGS